MSLTVYTYREGLLARIGHDLRIDAGPVALRREGEAVVLRVPVAALRVEGAMKDGRMEAIAPKDRTDIEAAMREDVLRSKQFPEVVCTVVADAVDLTLVGRTVRVPVSVARHDGRVRGSVTLTPSRWGIVPFKALLGALKLQDRVRVDFDLAWPDELAGRG